LAAAASRLRAESATAPSVAHGPPYRLGGRSGAEASIGDRWLPTEEAPIDRCQRRSSGSRSRAGGIRERPFRTVRTWLIATERARSPAKSNLSRRGRSLFAACVTPSSTVASWQSCSLPAIAAQQK